MISNDPTETQGALPAKDELERRHQARLHSFVHRRHSLRLYASQVAALSGFHPFASLPEMMVRLVYQGRDGQELMRQDAALLGLTVRSEEEILRELAAKASSETAHALESALDVKSGRKAMDTVQKASQLKQQVLEKAERSKKLSDAELALLREGVRSSVDTGYGSYHEKEALDLYEKQCGWEVRQRNAQVLSWAFARAEDLLADIDTPESGQEPTAVPLGKPRPIWQSVSSASSTALDTVNSDGQVESTESDEENNSSNVIQDSEDGTCCHPLVELSSTKEGSGSRQDTQNDAPSRPFFSISGSVDGIRDELWCRSSEGGDINDEDWALRQIVVECKHRMRRKFNAPPLYEQIQATVYCLMNGIDEADLVQVVRKEQPTEKRKRSRAPDVDNGKVIHQAKKSTSILPFLMPKSDRQSVSMHSSKSSQIEKADHERETTSEKAREQTDGFAPTASGTNKLSTDTDAVVLKNSSTAERAAVVLVSTSGAENADENCGSIAETNSPETDASVSLSTTIDHQVTLKQDVANTNGASKSSIRHDHMKDDNLGSSSHVRSAEKTKPPGVEIDVYRVSIDDPVMRHRQNWEKIILPRLRSFVDAVFRVRSDEVKRYQLLESISNPEGDMKEAWAFLRTQLPWLEDCDTAAKKR